MTLPQLIVLLCLMSVLGLLGGCVSHQTHELAMEELKLANQSSAQEIERLENLVQKEEATQRIQEEELGTLKQERQTLTSGILALKETISGTKESSKMSPSTSSSEPLNHERLSHTLQQLRTDLEGQYENFSRIRSEREALIQEVEELEVRLAKIVEQSTSQADLLQHQEDERNSFDATSTRTQN